MDPAIRKRIIRQFGTAVRVRRTALGISQEELADRAELDRTYVGGVERGERNLSVVNIVLLAEALATTASALVDGIGSSPTH